ncbi:c-type cytochrome [Rhodobium gokarnense]|uniref:Mono/diheme cytochrome c family protein n=1 Tax=Rhodobium gokarnense TaxID=364296 RepID=A0ABT3HDE9_9HYPH|nr:c-type cytochrome [Rhodobium gokarnense]MCW2308405.1 mono/diheme cytochrome c family protein [Rhodobium gokarnense]
MSKRVLAAAVLAAFTGVGVASCEEAPSPEERGRSIAMEHCAACHATAADDASALPEAPAFRDLGARYDVGLLEEALAEGIITGHPDMPEVVLDPEDIDAFIAYLRSIQVPR